MEQVLGRASLRRTMLLAFPTHILVQEVGTQQGDVLARLGRDSWFRVFLGKGRKVDLPDGTEWRIAAVGAGPYIEPVVTSKTGKLAIASPFGKRSYHLNGRDYAYDLHPTNVSEPRKRIWSLREYDRDIATCGPSSLVADYPVPLAAALLCFTLIHHGVPGEAHLGIPEFRWA